MKEKIIFIIIGLILISIPFIIGEMDLDIQNKLIDSLNTNQIEMLYTISNKFSTLTTIYCVSVISLIGYILKKNK